MTLFNVTFLTIEKIFLKTFTKHVIYVGVGKMW